MLNRIALSVLSVLAIAPGYAIAQPSTPTSLETPAAVVKALPENTAAVILVNTSQSTWEQFSQFQFVQETLSILQSFLPISLEDLAMATELGEIKNIPTWIGDRLAIVLMPTNGAEDIDMDSNILLLAQVKDVDRFNQFLEVLKSGQEQPPIERQYKGITILEWQAPAPAESPSPESPPEETPEAPSVEQTLLPQSTAAPSTLTKFLPKSPTQFLRKLKAVKPTPGTQPSEAEEETLPSPSETPDAGFEERGFAIALLPGYVATATTAQPLEQLIDEQNRSTNLMQSPLFRRTMQHSQFGTSLVTVYLNLAETTQFADFLPESPDPSLPLPSSDSFKTDLEKVNEKYSAVDFFTWLQPDGIRTQSSLYYQKPQPADQGNKFNANAEPVVAYLPAATYLAATGRNLKQQWQLVVEALSAEPEFKDVLREIRNFARLNLGVDIDRDITPWLDGDYAFSFFPTKQGLFNTLFPDINLGMAFIVQTSDRRAADIALERLNRFVRVESEGEIKTVTRELKGQPVNSWEAEYEESMQSFFAYSWVNENTLIVTTGLGAMADLSPKPYLPLTQNYTFKTAIEPFSSPNQGYFYVNMGSALAWAYNLLPYDDFPGVSEFKRIIGTVYSVSASASVTPEKEQFDSFIVLAPARKQQNSEEASAIPGLGQSGNRLEGLLRSQQSVFSNF